MRENIILFSYLLALKYVENDLQEKNNIHALKSHEQSGLSIDIWTKYNDQRLNTAKLSLSSKYLGFLFEHKDLY